MNWDAADFDWNQARAFLAAAEEGSLSAAARALGVTQPTLSRQVSALEDKLDVTLFERGPRAMTLTVAGRELMAHVRAMHEAATRMSLVASGQSQTIAGMVRIASTHSMATYHLPLILRELRGLAPELEVEVKTSNSLQDLIQREADIAIRHARPSEPELIAKLVRTSTGNLYASSEYLSRVGRPGSKEELSQLDFIGFEHIDQLIPFFADLGIELTRANFPISADTGPICTEFTRHGLGIGLLLDHDAAHFPELERVWPGFKSIEIQTWLVTHRELHTSRRIRLVYDLLAQHLAK